MTVAKEFADDFRSTVEQALRDPDGFWAKWEKREAEILANLGCGRIIGQGGLLCTRSQPCESCEQIANLKRENDRLSRRLDRELRRHR